MGTFQDSLNADSYSDCLESCHIDNDCQWAVYDSDGQLCTLLLDCSQVEDCSTCISSQRFCYSELATTTVATTTSSVASLLVGKSLGSHLNCQVLL